MSPDAQRVAIAEACGWQAKGSDETNGLYWHPILHRAKIAQGSAVWKAREKMELPMDTCGLPDYLADLNAMHEAEKVLTERQRFDYRKMLGVIVGGSRTNLKTFDQIHATGIQRAEAFLRIIGKWTE